MRIIRANSTRRNGSIVLHQSRALGAAQLGFSGGEPLLCDDLETLVEEARKLGFYTNLITFVHRPDRQAAWRAKERRSRSYPAFFRTSISRPAFFRTRRKNLTIFSRIRRPSISRTASPNSSRRMVFRWCSIAYCIATCRISNASSIWRWRWARNISKLANTQYYGWAHANRAQLMPTREQFVEAEATVGRYRKEIGDRCKVFFVVPDYYETRPKRCMNGWGQVFLGIAPDGAALPCHTARSLPGLEFSNVIDTPIKDIWYESDAFNRFRGFGWMKEPCRSCDEKTIDLGGCRCQAYLFTQDSANADPVCSKSPHHERVIEAACVKKLFSCGARSMRVRAVMSPRQARRMCWSKRCVRWRVAFPI